MNRFYQGKRTKLNNLRHTGYKSNKGTGISDSFRPFPKKGSCESAGFRLFRKRETAHSKILCVCFFILFVDNMKNL